MKEFTQGRIAFFVSILLIIILLAFFIVASFMSSVGYSQRLTARNNENIKEVFGLKPKEPSVIIIDPGHGGEDPGAVVSDIAEKDLNLNISKKIFEFLELSEYELMITREDDRMLYKDGEEHRKKFYDLYNRLGFTKEKNDSIFLSIHQNKFPLESCRGMQVFYGIKCDSSKLLATCVQNSVRLLQTDNTRSVKPGKNIYLLENADVPAVIIECGFISNAEDANALTDDEYTDKLAFLIYIGILEYLEEVKVES